MQKKVINIQFADNPGDVLKKIKSSIDASDEVASRMQRIAVDVGNWALSINNALKVLNDAKSIAKLGRMQSERAKQKDAAKQWGKLEGQAIDAINKYAKLAKAVQSLDKVL